MMSVPSVFDNHDILCPCGRGSLCVVLVRLDPTSNYDGQNEDWCLMRIGPFPSETGSVDLGRLSDEARKLNLNSASARNSSRFLPAAAMKTRPGLSRSLSSTGAITTMTKANTRRRLLLQDAG